MDLPETGTLNLFNKLLISLSDLGGEQEYCATSSIVRQCRSVVFGGEIVDYPNLFAIATHSGLITVKGNAAKTSPLGQKFLRANPERFFEITPGQKNLLAERVVFGGGWVPVAKKFFEIFSPHPGGKTYEFAKAEADVPRKLARALQLFKALGIVTETKQSIRVTESYASFVYGLFANRKAMSELELEQILIENRKLGVEAENAVVEFERRRLLALGRTLQADLVRRVSPIDVAAGYDIESFDGSSGSEVIPNRFIEVKATTRDYFRFYWTKNERSVARKRRDRYWIYGLVGFRSDQPFGGLPITIQDPDKSIELHSSLSIETHTFYVHEIDDLRLEEERIKDVRWYQLR